MNKTTKVRFHISNFAKIASALLSAVLYICANTTSSTMVHEPEAPDALGRFKVVK